MKISWFLSFAAVGVTAATGIAVVSCSSSSSSSPIASGFGQSCTKTSDCQGGLVCINDTCIKPPTPDGGGGGVVTSDGGFTIPAQLGLPCATTSDCASSLLTCVPFNSAVGGLCDYANFNIVNPDAGALMTCTGECLTAADCCELPSPPGDPATIFIGETEALNDAGQIVITPSKTVYLNQCSSILNVGLGGDPSVCSGTMLDAATSEFCFYYQTYCACAPNTWMCMNNACVYTGTCTVGTTAILGESQTLGQCPTETRATKHETVTCTGSADAASAGSCQAATCTDSTSCNGITAIGTTTPCQSGDCTCFQDGCYLECAQDLDCPAGYECDTTNHVCRQVPAKRCKTNNDCVDVDVLPGLPANATAICDPGSSTCKVPCTVDHDCSYSSGAVPALGAFSGNFCSAGFCAAVVSSGLSCTTNADCLANPGSGSVNMFCVTPAPTTVSVTSAVTTGAGGDAGL